MATEKTRRALLSHRRPVALLRALPPRRRAAAGPRHPSSASALLPALQRTTLLVLALADGLSVGSSVSTLRKLTPPRSCSGGSMSELALFVSRWVWNRRTIVWRYGRPGVTTIEGNLGWLTESGKCCVSRQNPPCFA